MNLLLLITLSLAIALADESQLLKEFAVGNGQFTADIYRELLKTKSGNFLVCPLSAEIILSLVHAGADGETAQQLSTGLHLPENKEKIQQIVQALNPLLEGNENYTLSSANKIYLKDGYKVQEQFKNVAVNSFNTEIQNINFEKKEQAASEINQWVEEKTHNKIKNVISPNVLTPKTRTLLVNAMYFHGKWAAAFRPENTEQKTFYRNNQDHVNIDMMEQTHQLRYSENPELNVKFLELPYIGDEVTMTIALPNDKEGLSALESRIHDVFVAPSYYSSKVHVVMPKFTFETTIEFNEILQALGIIKAFTDEANFSGILEDELLKIDEVLQKTFIEVDEKGTKAAAATSVYMPPRPAPPTPIEEFIADHPFIFYIKIRDVILFAGRYTN